MIAIKRHPRAKRLSLRITQEGVAQVVAPPRASEKQIHGFVERHRGWIEARLAARPQPVWIREGATLTVCGIPITLRHTGKLRGLARLEAVASGWWLVASDQPAIERDTGDETGHPSSTSHQPPATSHSILWLSGPPEHLGRKAVRWLQQTAHDTALPILDAACTTLGVAHRGLRVRDLSSRWGSCTAQGVITLNWRLVFAPQEVMRYVLLHAAAHLKHMDQSPRFWSVVAGLMPEYNQARHWLKTHGAELHAYGVDE